MARTIRPPESGELKHRMEVRLRIDTPSGTTINPEYQRVCMRWVKVEPLGTATYASAQQTKTGMTHRLYCRFIPDLGAGHEFVARGRVYRVLRPTGLGGDTVWSVIEVEELGPVSPAEVLPQGGEDEQFSFS